MAQVKVMRVDTFMSNFRWLIKFINQQMKKYLQTIQFQVYMEQVSGKQPKLLSSDRSKLLKGFNAIQKDFYIQISTYHFSHPFAGIRHHIPQFYGVLQLDSDPSIKLAHENQEKSTIEWLNHLAGRYKIRNDSNKFIVLQNLTYGLKLPNILDIKIGGRNVEGKKHKITKSVSQFYLKLNGCKLNYGDEENSSIFLSKYYLAEAIESDTILQHLGLFFFDGTKVRLESVSVIRDKLQDLILSFKALRGYKFISSSVCIIYDAKNRLIADVKLLDFGRVTHCSPDFIDEDTLSGLVNIHLFLAMLLENGQTNIQNLQKLKKYYSETNITIVPEKKKIKYNDTSDQSPIKT